MRIIISHLLSNCAQLLFNSRFEKINKNPDLGTREMAQLLRALLALGKDLTSSPNTHTAAHSCRV